MYTRRPALVAAVSISLLALVLTFLYVRQSRHDRAVRQVLAGLKADSVRVITLYPCGHNSLVDDPLVIKDHATVVRLVDAYQGMRPEEPGDGRLSGYWQVKLVFSTYDQREVGSEISHNDFSDLVFVYTPTVSSSERVSLSDYFSTNKIAPILLKVVAQK